MNNKITYTFSGEIWQHSGAGGWHFVSLPTEISMEIRKHLQWQEEGWGRMKAIANLDGHAWETAIWFDTKLNTYLLPIKGLIRKQAGIRAGDTISISISI